MRIQARLAASVPMPDGLPSNIQWMPPGRHTINALQGDKPATLTVSVTPDVAQRMKVALQRLRAKAAAGVEDLPYFDLNHEDNGASAYPTEFYWGGNDRTTGGVRTKIEWTDLGTQAIAGKVYRRFSPLFGLDDDGEVQPADLNMGGFVNRAAFKSIEPLFARDASAPAGQRTISLPDWMHPWWAVYLNEKAKLSEMHNAEIEPLHQTLSSLEKQLAQTPASDRAAIAEQIAAVRSKIDELGEVDGTQAWDSAAAADPDGYRDFLEWIEMQKPKSNSVEYSFAKAGDRAEAVKCKESPAFYAFYCAAHGYGNASNFEPPKSHQPALPFVQAAQFLAKRDGVGFADACEVLAKEAPEFYEAYRAQQAERPAQILLDTHLSFVMAKANSMWPIIRAKAEDDNKSSAMEKRDPLEDENARYEKWRQENLLKGK
jgi:phage I-like protein